MKIHPLAKQSFYELAKQFVELAENVLLVLLGGGNYFCNESITLYFIKV